MVDRMACEEIIEPATSADVPDLLRLEETCFSAPWTRKMFEAELTGNQFARFLVARQRDPETAALRTVGYLCFWVVFEEIRLMNLAVIEAVRRRGLATQFVTRALQMGKEQGAMRAVLEVRASNHPAILLYEKLGFRRVATRAKYYSNPIEDAVLMEREPINMASPA
jgi:ribosomal-protein-alanine N-acetyltransferase